MKYILFCTLLMLAIVQPAYSFEYKIAKDSVITYMGDQYVKQIILEIENLDSDWIWIWFGEGQYQNDSVEIRNNIWKRKGDFSLYNLESEDVSWNGAYYIFGSHPRTKANSLFYKYLKPKQKFSIILFDDLNPLQEEFSDSIVEFFLPTLRILPNQSIIKYAEGFALRSIDDKKRNEYHGKFNYEHNCIIIPMSLFIKED